MDSDGLRWIGRGLLRALATPGEEGSSDEIPRDVPRTRGPGVDDIGVPPLSQPSLLGLPAPPVPDRRHLRPLCTRLVLADPPPDHAQAIARWAGMSNLHRGRRD